MSSSFLLAIRQTHPLRLRATLDVSCLQATLAIAAATSLRDSTCAVSWPLWMNPAFGRLHISLAFGRLYMSLAFGRLWMRFWHCHSRLALFQLLPYQTELIYISSGTFQLMSTLTSASLANGEAVVSTPSTIRNRRACLYRHFALYHVSTLASVTLSQNLHIYALLSASLPAQTVRRKWHVRLGWWRDALCHYGTHIYVQYFLFRYVSTHANLNVPPANSHRQLLRPACAAACH